MIKKSLLLLAVLVGVISSCQRSQAASETTDVKLVTISSDNLITPEGDTLLIKGTNLGNWLNPEGYMFGFKATNSPHLIDLMLKQLVGPTQAREFWAAFKDRYITRADIEYIARTGANTIRLPFNYRMFTSEDYMGLNSPEEGFRRVDSVVEWCRDNGLYLILDMHDAPGGQTGDNIDDSYGYPWLLEDEECQQQFCDIWKSIAERYKSEPVILGYELCNEPIAPYFENMDSLNSLLEPLYKRATAAIRKIDPEHIILLGGAQWNGNFEPFQDWTFDDKIMYTCHRYGSDPTADAIRGILDFKAKTGLPMYMGEIGHNTDEWQQAFCKVLIDNNIGYTFWPYKKLDGSCMMAVNRPADWDTIVAFAEAPRGSYQQIREARPSQALSQRILAAYLDSILAPRCVPQASYIRSINLHP
ncbi:MAG: glycoside hydrolase family 5 protein [Bacteroidales bacterium]|nr:glycoside hydrolase family 5 protein [Bacteroidales bacterium]